MASIKVAASAIVNTAVGTLTTVDTIVTTIGTVAEIGNVYSQSILTAQKLKYAAEAELLEKRSVLDAKLRAQQWAYDFQIQSENIKLNKIGQEALAMIS